MAKATTLEPNEHGVLLCPYCDWALTGIVREWMKPPAITDYVCHHCQIGFKIKVKGDLYGY